MLPSLVMVRFLFTYIWCSILIGVGLVVLVLASEGQTVEWTVAHTHYFLVPGIIWLMVVMWVRMVSPSILTRCEIPMLTKPVAKKSALVVLWIGKSISLGLYGSAIGFYFLGTLYSDFFEGILVYIIAYITVLLPYFIFFGVQALVTRYVHRKDFLYIEQAVDNSTELTKKPIQFWIQNNLHALGVAILTLGVWLLWPARWWLQKFSTERSFRNWHYVVLACIVISAVFYAAWVVTRPVALSPAELAGEYELVRDTVPMDGPIVVKLPAEASKFGARFKVDFDPSVQSWWGRTTSAEHIVFKLREPLEENNFYTISYEQRDGTVVTKQFRAVQRPRIDVFQPETGSTNVRENTILTFTFNRPMIPLQSLDRTYATDLPIVITPKTEGDFVWVSQRQLEFIPKQKLQRASNYTVQVLDGLYSIDGLQVPPQEYAFTVNPLQVVSGSSHNIRAQDPIAFSFNQPVAIEQLVIAVEDEVGEVVPVRLEYAYSFTYNPETEQKEKVIDRSQILVWPKKQNDRFAFGATYTYALRNIVPLEGHLGVPDIEGVVAVQKLLTRSEVLSDRTVYAKPNYFDPQGTIRLHFTQPIDVSKLTVAGKGVRSVEHRSLCLVSETECGEYDPEAIDITFNETVFDFNESFVLTISDFYDESGTQIGDFSFSIDLKTFDRLSITDVVPVKNNEHRELIICSTNPLIEYDRETYTDLITTLQPVTFYSTGRSQYIAKGKDTIFSKILCEESYKTLVRYSLPYETEFDVRLTPQDVFGDQTTYVLQFTTSEAPKKSDADTSKPWLDNLHRVYTVTPPDRTKYTYVTDNLEYVELSICKMTPLEMITRGGKLQRGSGAPTNCIERKTETLSLRDTDNPDYFQVDIADYFNQPLGHYVITLTHPELTYSTYKNGERYEHQYYDHMYTSVTNLSLVEKRTNQIDLTSSGIIDRKTDLLQSENGTNLYWTTDHRTLEPITGATVFVYKDTQPGSGVRLQLGASALTDAAGIALTNVVPDTVGSYVVSGEDSAIVSSWADVIGNASRAQEIEKTYLYTDRPIYRPGDEVFLKGIHRIGYDAEYEILQAENLTVIVQGADQSQLLTKQVEISTYGTFSESVRLPEDAALGTYQVYVKNTQGSRLGYETFSVEEYTPSPFEVIATSDTDEYIAGDTLAMDITAQYFFGAPVAEGTVSYAITSQNYYFDKSKDPRFRFGAGWYQCYHCGYNNSYIKSGEMPLTNGQALLEEELDFDSLFDADDQERSKIIVVNTTVKDGNGRSVSVQKSFIVHRAERYVAVRSTPYFLEALSPATLQMKTVDTAGVGTSETVRVTITKPEWKEYKRREVDGSFYTHSEEEIVEVYAADVMTDASGFYAFEYVFPEPGRYTITVSGTDARGNVYEAQRYQYVYGDGSASVRTNNDRTLDIAVENTDVAVGDVSKLIIQSPYENAKALVTVERGRVMEYEVIDVDKNFFDYDFVAKSSHAPSVQASVVLLSSTPEIKYGTVTFTVDKSAHELDIAVTSNKSVYLPGEEVTLSVQTKTNDGKPVPAEVSISAVDLSVLALKGNPERDPLEYFFGRFTHNVVTSANLKYVHEEIEIPTGTKGGGGSADDLAKRERGTFKDTAFWQSDVITDENGMATVRFTLPDNLTRWRVESIGVTTDTKVGVDYMEFEEKKDLITTPLLPRFVVPGDQLSLGAEILNRTNAPQTITFTIESETLVIEDSVTTITIPAEGSRTVFVSVESPRTMTGGVHSVLFKASNGQFEDAVRKPIPVVENTLYETVFLSGLTNGTLVEETFVTPTDIHQDSGEVKIEAYSTVGAYLEDSLNYMAAYPYGCSEQLASKIATLATVRYLTSLENIGAEYELETISFRGSEYSVDDAIDSGLQQIYDHQNSDGGFGYYRNLHSNVPLSLHVFSVLHDLEAVGVVIDTRVMSRAQTFVETIADTKNNKDSIVDRTYSTDTLFSTLYVLDQMDPRPRSVDSLVGTARTKITRENVRGFSTHSLVHAALVSDELWWWDRRSVWNEIDRRLKENTEGVYISKSPVSFAKSFYETDVKNTALLLRAIIDTDRNVSDAPNIVSWLLSRRSDDGAWSTTNTTHEVVQSLTDYIDWRKEQLSDVAITAILDGVELATHQTATEPRLEGLQAEVGYNTLGLDAEHKLSFTQTEDDTRDTTMYYDVAMKYYLDREQTPARDEGVQVRRELFALEDVDKQTPLTTATVGDTIVGRVTFTAGSPMRMMALEDKIPAGFEIINFEYATENKQVLDAAIRAAAERAKAEAFDVYGYMETLEYQALEAVTVYKDEKETLKPSRTQYVRDFGSAVEELHDDRIFLFRESLSPGTYQYEYYLRALVPGTFQHLPVWVGEMYNPSFFGRAGSAEFTVEAP